MKEILSLVTALVVATSLGPQRASAQVERSGDKQDSTEEAQRRQTRQTMVARWKKLNAVARVDGEEREVERVPEPIFTFSESTRESGHLGTLWVWGVKGRPVALLSQSKSFGEPVWGFELAAMSEGVSVVMHDGWKWSPESSLTMLPLKDAPPPADSEAKRLVQMKNLVRQFALTEQYSGETFELRLLPRPIYRYQDADAGLIDGALFNFAHGTNPEAVAVIECQKRGPAATWSYGFLPIAGAGVEAKLDGKTVWTKDATRESKSQGMYSTWLETIKE